MDMTLINPSPEEVHIAILQAVKDANYRARTRTVEIDISHALKLIFDSESGFIEEDGGSVANAYKEAAYSSQIAVAWCSDSKDQKHVRIKGCRVRCNNRHVNTPFGIKRDSIPAQQVGLDDYEIILAKMHKKGLENICIDVIAAEMRLAGRAYDMKEIDRRAKRVYKEINKLI